jgi:spermidine/putrescine transport system ATP-binding protein
MSTAPSAGGEGDLRLEGLTKRFGGVTAVDGIDLEVPAGSFMALLGPSGCGKTTTLRMVAGLEEPTEGRILIGDVDVAHLKPYKRPVNTVFQNYALFPHLDVFENIAFGLRRTREKDIKPRVHDMLELVQLSGYEKRRPSEISGGQAQRVALARALINRPKMLLLDEPLGALDLKLRREMQLTLKRIQTEVGITFLHVTHDQEEAMTMADTIAVMNAGHIEQMGGPVDLYEKPRTAFVANFLGQSNLIKGRIVGRSGATALVKVGDTTVAMPVDGDIPTGEVHIGVRPEKLRMVADDADVPDAANVLTGVITDVSFTGVSTQYLVEMDWGQELTVFAQNAGDLPRRTAERVRLLWRPENTFVIGAPATSSDVSAPVA